MKGKRKKKAEKMYGRYRRAFPEIAEMDVGQALELYSGGDIVFVDIRDSAEQEVSMLPGAMTENDFLAHPTGFGNKCILCYCTIGYRSGLFVQQHGREYSRLHNLKGGILLWLHAGGGLEREGIKTHHVHVYGSKWALQPSPFLPVFT